MFIAAYDLLNEILDDEELHDWIKFNTGKDLSVNNAGKVLSYPCVEYVLNSARVRNYSNSMQDADYDVNFYIPLFGLDAQAKLHAFLDVITRVFYGYEVYSQGNNKVHVRYLDIAIERYDDAKIWVVKASVSIAMYKNEEEQEMR